MRENAESPWKRKEKRKPKLTVVVIDMHGDYVMMDRLADENRRHSMFNVVVYYPPKAPRVMGVTVEVRELKISPREMSNGALMDLSPFPFNPHFFK